MEILSVLQGLGIPAVYGRFKEPQKPPYAIYLGAGQEYFEADNTYFTRRNLYRVEYYFIKKSSEQEAALEDALLDAGFLYEKSDDAYIEQERVFVIYYTVWKK